MVKFCLLLLYKKKSPTLSVLMHTSEGSLCCYSVSVREVFKSCRCPHSHRWNKLYGNVDKLYVCMTSLRHHRNNSSVVPPKPHSSCILHKFHLERCETCTIWTRITKVSKHAETRRGLLSDSRSRLLLCVQQL